MTAVRALTCPACGGQIEIKAAGYTVAVACQHCGSALDVSRPEVELITRHSEAAAAMTLPLGTRGTLSGVEWEVIGFLERSDGEAEWNEYLLFNPYAGYRWLVESEDGWQLGTPLTDRPTVLSESQVRWKNVQYSCDYEPATTETRKVVGEFYWRVQRGDTVQATTWSSYGSTLSSEWAGDEESWTHLVAVNGRDMATAFNVTPKDGGAPAARFGGPIDSSYPHGSGLLFKAFQIAVVTLAASLVVFMLTWVGVGSGEAVNTLVLEIGGAEKNAVIGTIQVDKPHGFVVINAQSTDFTNKWVDLDYSLINLDTQQAYTGYDTLEYYTGRDSDGNWSEGSTALTTRFGRIPRGRYEVVVDASAHSWGASVSADGQYNGWGGDAPLVVTFRARPAGMYVQDLLMVIGPLLFVPLVIWIITRKRSDDE